MSARLLIRAAGPGASLQDPGRRGWLRFGVTPAGPMDAAAFAISNAAAGAPPGAVAIEIGLGGLEITAEGETVGIALAGSDFAARLDDAPLPSAFVAPLAPGQRLVIRAGALGAWCYLAPFAEIDTPLVMGSRATHWRSGLGGLGGRMLAAGDALPLVRRRTPPAAVFALTAPALARRDGPLRLLPGPQDDYFAPEAFEALFGAEWRVGARSDRMAYRLEGPPLAHAKGADIVSDGATMGAIQVPGDGAPLVLMADRQPTGGYPKIAHVITADLPALAQLRPGETLRFTPATHEEAVAARREQAERIARGVELTPLRREASTEILLGENLIGGVVDATGDMEREPRD